MTNKNIEYELKNSNIRYAFYSLKGELVKSPYLTGRMISINTKQIFNTYFSWNEASEYFQTMGINYDLSKEHNEFKTEILIAAGYNNSNTKNIQKVRKLLNDKNYN